MATSTKDLRSIAVIGHGSSGKTTLVERLLFDTKTTSRFGRVIEGTSILDVASDEKERGSSIDMHFAHLMHAGADITLIDTPGAADFAGEAICALGIVEAALVCVDAKDGVKVNTRKLWKKAEELGVPRFIAVTRNDVDQADFEARVKQCQQTFGDKCVPLFLPNASGGGFKSVEAVLEPAANASDRAKQANQKLVEAAVESDEALMMRYLDGEKLAPEVVRGAFTKAVVAGKLHPIIPVSSETGVGVKELLDTMAKLFPSPVDRRPKAKKGDALNEVPVDAPFSGLVFKVVIAEAGRFSYVKVFSGQLEDGQGFENLREGKHEKGAHLFRVQGKDRDKAVVGAAGMIIALPKIETLHRGDTIAAQGFDKGTYTMPSFPKPLNGVAVSPKKSTDAPKLLEGLHKLEAEDPTFKVEKDQETGQLLIEGLSQLHLNVMIKRLFTRSKVEVDTARRKVPYRETITTGATDRYRHKKQSGGSGEFAEVELRIEPMERDKGFEYAWEVVGMNVGRQFMPSIEKGIRDTLPKGAIAGYPIVDVKAAVTDGKEHPVDSKDRAFQKAGREAFKAAIKKAKPVLLEPIVKIEVTIPGDKVGDIQSDLGGGRRGQILNSEFAGDYATITAHVPLAEVMEYDQQLRSMTGGEGTFAIEPSHYAQVPGNIQQHLVAEYEKHKVEEKD